MKHRGALLSIILGVALLSGCHAGKTAPATAHGAPPVAVKADAPPAPAGRPAGVTVFKVPIEGSPTTGAADAPVTLVEFTDYQCPFCGRAEKTVRALQAEYGPALRVVVKELPLSFHPHARPAALAVLAAGAQGKYWEMHQRVFDHQSELSDETLEEIASQVGLDLPTWRGALEAPELEEVIRRDTALAATLGVNGTPAFFINGRKLSGAQPIEKFRAVIDEEKAEAAALVASGVRPADVYARATEHGLERAPKPAPRPATARPEPKVVKVDVPGDAAVKGPKNAPVTVVEFSDFECPFCRRAAEEPVRQLLAAHPKEVRLVFRHLPLDFHPHARGAAEAAVAAQAQGRFWEMHDWLFAHQDTLDEPSLVAAAKALGLNAKRFARDRASDETHDRLEADKAAAQLYGATGTPTFFVNGRTIVGAVPYAKLEAVFTEELTQAKKLLAAGTPRDQLYQAALEANLAGERGAALPKVGNAPVRGPANAPVTVIEYADFQCPFCRRAQDTLTSLQKLYGDKVRIAFKQQPLEMHRNARDAALAALAADEQGKFWEYHDTLFAHPEALDRASLEGHARALGLDVEKFKSAMASKRLEDRLGADITEAERVGAEGVPTFFINGERVVGAVPASDFQRAIDAALSKHK